MPTQMAATSEALVPEMSGAVMVPVTEDQPLPCRLAPAQFFVTARLSRETEPAGMAATAERREANTEVVFIVKM